MRTLKFDWEIKYSWGLKKPFREAIVQRKTEFHFVNELEEIKTRNDSYMVIFNTSTSKEELLNEYYIKLKFFPCFGFNWDALSDSLVCLENIQQKHIVIYHHILPQLNDNDMKIFLEILKDSSGEWIGMDWCTQNHIIDIYFNMQDYDKVQRIVEK
jgi:hypothetical protein